MKNEAPYKGIYMESDSVMDWLNHHMFPIEEAVFHMWRRLKPLVRLVDLAEAAGDENTSQKYVARSAIKQFNDNNGELITYEELRDRCSNYFFSDFGQWAAYTDNMVPILFGDYDVAEEAFYYADPSVQWVVVYLPEASEIIVYRSPYKDYREATDYDTWTADGMTRGDTLTYVLPPGIEGAIKQDYTNYQRE